tara:strand:+ start:547 stop:756 length:210 start_codon:yes stop_codon:yes gene_type:complete
LPKTAKYPIIFEMMKENMSEIELTHEDVNQLYNIVESYLQPNGQLFVGTDNELSSASILSLLEKLEKHI